MSERHSSDEHSQGGPVTPSSFLRPGNACRRSRLPGWLRLAITFGVLFTLKYAIPLLGVGAALQVLVLLVVATGLAWQFWWNCSPDRRGVAILIGVLWAAGLVKLLRL
jgi:hypothetical protein